MRQRLPGRAITFGEREDHIAQATSEGRQIRDHDSFLGPATIYLDRLDRGKRGSVAKAETTGGRRSAGSANRI